jgi:hypothetical protein
MYKPLPEFLTIKKSDIHGLGLYAIEKIPENYNLGITHVCDKRFENNLIRTPLGGFFNHSDIPNCKVITSGDFLMLVSLKIIFPEEEITASYTIYNPAV